MQLRAPVLPTPTCSGGHNRRLRTSMPSLQTQAVPRQDQGAETAGGLRQAVQEAVARGAAAVCAVSLALSPLVATASEEGGGRVLLRFPASSDPEVYTTQATLMEAWSIVGESFVDDTFNGHSWPLELKQHMLAAYGAADGAAAFQEIGNMLGDLGDPYTRIIPPAEYEDFRVSSDGELHGVGLLIANEPYNNHLLVLGSIRGGPADRAGIVSGDEVVSINGTATDGWTGEMAAKVLRGQGGTEVRVKIARRTDGIPGVPGRPEPPLQVLTQEMKLKRERVNLSPLYYTPVETGRGLKLGYLRLASFTQNAAQEMHSALNQLERSGCNGYVLDLRDNPGGLVQAGLDVARLWMDGAPDVFLVSGREDEPVQRVMLDKPGGAVTHDPLVVLVNSHSASASEILTGALRDNERALVLGDTNTFGKGKIQSVYELADGSGLFVTVAKYRTPKGDPIDMVGIKPDQVCGTPAVGLVPQGSSGKPGKSGMLMEASSQLGLSMATGLGGGVAQETALVQQLFSDKCLMSAVELLKHNGANQQQQQGGPQVGPLLASTEDAGPSSGGLFKRPPAVVAPALS